MTHAYCWSALPAAIRCRRSDASATPRQRELSDCEPEVNAMNVVSIAAAAR